MENNTNQKIIKRIIFTLIIGITIILMSSNVLAYKLYCLNYGQSLPFFDIIFKTIRKKNIKYKENKFFY